MKQVSGVPSVRQETRSVNFTFTLRKDLCSDEVVCEHCNGTGLAICDNIFGVSGDVVHVSVHFPYNNQSIHSCSYCFNGVMRKCSACGRLRAKNDYACVCGYESKRREALRLESARERWAAATKLSQSLAFTQFSCLYVENLDRYVFNADELECAVEDYLVVDADISNLRVYGTSVTGLFLDADELVLRECEDLHNDAYNRCDIAGLQVLLDAWCSEQEGAETYFPDYEVGIIVFRGDVASEV